MLKSYSLISKCLIGLVLVLWANAAHSEECEVVAVHDIGVGHQRADNSPLELHATGLGHATHAPASTLGSMFQHAMHVPPAVFRLTSPPVAHAHHDAAAQRPAVLRPAAQRPAAQRPGSYTQYLNNRFPGGLHTVGRDGHRWGKMVMSLRRPQQHHRF